MKTLLLPLSLLLCAPLLAAGNGLRDPTRPLAATVRATNAGTAPRTAAPVAPVAPVVPVVPPQLQLVLVGHDRRYAVIDGELVAGGDTVRGLALLQILDDAVVLKTPNGPRTLPLSVPVEQ